jgi:RND family efflux transporter MFP subunit
VKDLKIPVYVGLEGEEGYPHKGVIDFADNRVNPSTGTIQVRGVLPNPNRILDAGMRARVRVPVSDPYKALMISERAIGTDQGRRFVYVVNEQNIVERKDVQLGRLHDGLQVVQQGVKPEDWVVVNGIQRVRDGAKVEPRRTSMPGSEKGVGHLLPQRPGGCFAQKVPDPFFAAGAPAGQANLGSKS